MFVSQIIFALNHNEPLVRQHIQQEIYRVNYKKKIIFFSLEISEILNFFNFSKKLLSTLDIFPYILLFLHILHGQKPFKHFIIIGVTKIIV